MKKDRIQELEKEIKLLERIVELEKELHALKQISYPTYPVYPTYPINPNFPIVTYTGTGKNDNLTFTVS